MCLDGPYFPFCVYLIGIAIKSLRCIPCNNKQKDPQRPPHSRPAVLVPFVFTIIFASLIIGSSITGLVIYLIKLRYIQIRSKTELKLPDAQWWNQ